MPLNTPSINDLSLPVGTFTASFGGNMTPVTYYVENFTYNNVQSITNVPNEIGATRGRIGLDLDKGGSMTLTLPNASSFPKFGATGSIPPGFASGSAVTVFISGLSQNRGVNDYGKVDVEWLLANP